MEIHQFIILFISEDKLFDAFLLSTLLRIKHWLIMYLNYMIFHSEKCQISQLHIISVSISYYESQTS